MAALAAWLTVTAASLGDGGRPDVGQGGRPFCFAFVLAAGLPMAMVAILALRRTRSLTAVRSLVAAGLGVAFLALGLMTVACGRRFIAA